jgi:ABC-type amino acid transport system permease subunit
MNSITSTTEVEAPAAAEPDREQLPFRDADSAKNVERHSKTDDWMMLAMILCMALYAGAFAAHILYPAMATVARSSVQASGDQGP